MNDYRDLNEAVNKALRDALAAYDAAATKFIEKVDRGEARSFETYRELRACRVQAQKARHLFGLRS